MEDKRKTNDLQSRRQFFKRVVKSTLPILGAIALSQMPIIGHASSTSEPMGCSVNSCSGGCSSSCYKSCEGGCYRSCLDRCDNTCKGCDNSCQGYCIRTCNGSCYGGSR